MLALSTSSAEGENLLSQNMASGDKILLRQFALCVEHSYSDNYQLSDRVIIKLKFVKNYMASRTRVGPRKILNKIYLMYISSNLNFYSESS